MEIVRDSGILNLSNRILIESSNTDSSGSTVYKCFHRAWLALSVREMNSCWEPCQSSSGLLRLCRLLDQTLEGKAGAVNIEWSGSKLATFNHSAVVRFRHGTVESDSPPHREYRISPGRLPLESGRVSLGSRLLRRPRSLPDLCPVLVLEYS